MRCIAETFIYKPQHLKYLYSYPAVKRVTWYILYHIIGISRCWVAKSLAGACCSLFPLCASSFDHPVLCFFFSGVIYSCSSMFVCFFVYWGLKGKGTGVIINPRCTNQEFKLTITIWFLDMEKKTEPRLQQRRVYLSTIKYIHISLIFRFLQQT